MQLRLMRFNDLTFCDELRALVGWNQRRQDWERFLRLSPSGCFIAELNGKAAGTVTTIQYGTRVGWVGMLLVHPSFRGRGVGTALLEHAIKFLHDEKVECVKLDATPQGEPIYARMGFVKEFQISRWEATHLQLYNPDARELTVSRLERAESIVGLDERAFGVARPELMRELFSDSASALVCSRKGKPGGFGMLREGSLASYLGPVIAEDHQAAQALIQRLLQSVSGKIFWDVPESTASDEIPKKLGFQVQRRLWRMRLGSELNASNPEWYWGLADPSCG